MARALRRRVAARLKRGSTRPAAPRGPVPTEAERAAMSDEDRPIIERAFPHTMTGFARLQGLVDAVRYLERSGVPGAFAECGVWRGGSVLAMLLTLQDEGTDDRDVYLYDTFEGMTRPTEEDTSPVWSSRRSRRGSRPRPRGSRRGAGCSATSTRAPCARPCSRAAIRRRACISCAAPSRRRFPGTVPDELALLRLDTDWYESTRHELEHLYPRLNPGGVLIIDDYGHWEGARRAVDEYFEKVGEQLVSKQARLRRANRRQAGAPAARW